MPFVVVVKVGTPSETSKPGNRGKRDTQLLIMRFLNRVHFNSPMSPLELELVRQMKTVLRIEPQWLEFLMWVDAGKLMKSHSHSLCY
jgi:chitin synthase